jgi:hypothetical protein
MKEGKKIGVVHHLDRPEAFLMTSSQAFCCRALAVLALAALAAFPCAARGQEGRELIGRRNDLIEVEDVVDQLDPLRVERFLREFALMTLGRGDGEQARRRLESRLKFRIDQIDRVCKLSPEQRSKLNVAGRGDMRRFFAQIDALKAKWADVAIEVDVQALHARLIEQVADSNVVKTETDCFGDGSLYSKVLKSTLTPEQMAVRENTAKDAAIALHRTTVRWAIGSMEPWLHLSSEQREKLEVLLFARTKPPRKFGSYDYYGLMFQASKLPEKDFKSIFSGRQWEKVEKQLAEARRLEKTLRDGGFLPDEDVADAGKARQNGPVSEPEQPRC